MTLPTEPAPTDLVEDGRAEHVKEHVGTALSTLGMVAMATGVAWGLWPRLGPFAVAVGGLFLVLLVALAGAARAPRPAPADAPARLVGAPGPTDPGLIHVKGPGARP